MLRISRLTDYGTMILAQMARDKASLHTSSKLSKQTKLALPTVSKLLKTLANGGILTSYRGAKGGYRLALDPEQISVYNIINILEGPIAITECNETAGACELEYYCSIREPWNYINRAITTTLTQISLASLSQNTRMFSGEVHEQTR